MSTTKTPTHVLLSRVWAGEQRKLIHHILLFNTPEPDVIVANKAVKAQEYHSIRFPKRKKALRKEDEPPRVQESVFMRTLAYIPDDPRTRTTPYPEVDHKFEYYSEILDNTLTKIWSFDRHPPAFNKIHVAYKISWQGVDIMLSPAVKGRGKKAALQVDTSTDLYKELHSPEHKSPQFKYHNNRMEELWGAFPLGWELFRGKVIYNGTYVPGEEGGLDLGGTTAGPDRG